MGTFKIDTYIAWAILSAGHFARSCAGIAHTHWAFDKATEQLAVNGLEDKLLSTAVLTHTRKVGDLEARPAQLSLRAADKRIRDSNKQTDQILGRAGPRAQCGKVYPHCLSC